MLEAGSCTDTQGRHSTSLEDTLKQIDHSINSSAADYVDGPTTVRNPLKTLEMDHHG